MEILFANGKAAYSEGVTAERVEWKDGFACKLTVPPGECACIALTMLAPISIDGTEYSPVMNLATGLIEFDLDGSGKRWRMWAIPRSNAVEIADVPGSRVPDFLDGTTHVMINDPSWEEEA